MTVRTDKVLLESMVDVDYTVDDPAIENAGGKLYPITIKNIFLRGGKLDSLLHVSHYMMLQRRIYIKLIDEGVL